MFLDTIVLILALYPFIRGLFHDSNGCNHTTGRWLASQLDMSSFLLVICVDNNNDIILKTPENILVWLCHAICVYYCRLIKKIWCFWSLQTETITMFLDFLKKSLLYLPVYFQKSLSQCRGAVMVARVLLRHFGWFLPDSHLKCSCSSFCDILVYFRTCFYHPTNKVKNYIT